MRESLLHHLPLELLFSCKLPGKLFVVGTTQHGGGSGRMQSQRAVLVKHARRRSGISGVERESRRRWHILTSHL